MSVILSENPIQGIDRVGSNIHFLVAPFVAYVIYKSNVDMKHMVLVIKLSVLIGAVYAIYGNLYLGVERAEVGADSPTIFGFIMGFFGFISIIDIWTQSNKEKLFSVIIFSLAIYSVVLSGTLIALVICIALSCTTIFIWFIRGLITKQSLILIVIALTLSTTIFMSNKEFSNKINLSFNEIKTFSNDNDSQTSVALRLSMWSGGLKAFKQKPIIGYGYQNTGQEVSRHVYALTKSDLEKLTDGELILKAIGSGNANKIEFGGPQALDPNVPSYEKELANREELIDILVELSNCKPFSKCDLEKLDDRELILKAIGSGNADKIEFGSPQALDPNVPSYEKELANREELIEALEGLSEALLEPKQEKFLTSYAQAFTKDQKMLHNDYINSLVGFGILGLLALLALLFFPLIIFFIRLRDYEGFTRNAIGVLFIIAISVFAITDSIYTHSVMRSFVVFFLGFLLLKDTKD
ncbi:O-antigen ligase [Candidatus Thioglobus sp. NP1]|uniref:O-antigen ligase family protein n=1 Tax=Candidatus Thioglobus sp. NP1 TaxID=2508687 RepID=UPI001C2B9C81|nr:O-antigen ligase family protein [Candidatus Thioglobus sp. NP1]